MSLRSLKLAGLFSLIAMLTACGGMTAGFSAGMQTNSTATATEAERPTQTFSSAHFVFHYTSLDANNIAATAARVEADYTRILEDLGADNMPPVHVTLYPDHRQFELATTALAGYTPSWTVGLVTSQTAIHIMSPNLPQWGSYNSVVNNIVHEFVHCVSMHVNGTIANHPRWIWESVAIYESGQFIDPHTLGYMTAHQPPTFAQLDSIDDTRTYQIGYTIAEYIAVTYGPKALHEMVLHNGDTQMVLGLPQSQFEQQWFDWVRQKYGV